MNFAFFGTPSLAVEILDALATAGYVPSVIVTTPDRPQGRGMKMKETPVAEWARKRGVEVLKPDMLDAGFIDNFRQRHIAFSIVVAYGKILPQPVLDTMPMYNIHYSLLPRWRGATPVEAAILAGDAQTGVTIQKIIHKLDAGPIVASAKTDIGLSETAPILRLRLNTIAADLLVGIMPQLQSSKVRLAEQDEAQITTCGKISKDDGCIDLSDDAEVNYRKFRAYFGWPGVYTFFERLPARGAPAGGGKSASRRIRAIITRAHLERETFVIDAVKPEGKREMYYADFLRSGPRPTSSQ